MGTSQPYTKEFVVQLYLSKLHKFAFALAKDAFKGKIFLYLYNYFYANRTYISTK